MHWTVLDLPVHAGFALPDFQRLFLRQAVAQAMPRGSANVSHLFDSMSHGNDSFSLAHDEAAERSAGISRRAGWYWRGVVMDQMGTSSCVKREMNSSSGMTAAK